MSSIQEKDYQWIQSKVKNIPLYLRGLETLMSRKMPDEDKVLVSKAIEYVVNASDLIPDHLPSIGFVDDLLIVFCTLETLSKKPHWKETRANVFILSTFPEDLKTIRSYFAEAYDKISELFRKSSQNGKIIPEAALNSLVEGFNVKFSKVYRELPKMPAAMDIITLVKKFINF